MGAPRLLSGLFAAVLALCTAAAVGLTPGVVDLDLVFPLNDTYAPQDGPLPIVFALSSQPFQPALASTLQLHLSYILLDIRDQSHSLASGNFDLGKLSSSRVDNPYFFNYSDKLAGHESQFALQCTVSLVAGVTSNDNSSTGDNKQSTIVTNPNLIYNAYFTTQSGAQAADVPISASNRTTCLPHAGWNMAFDVTDYVQIKSDTYAVLAPNSLGFGQRPCAVEVDAATAASIAADMATATAPTTTTTTTANSSSSGPAASTAAASSGPGIVAAFWSLLMLGLSAVLFVC